MAFWFGMKSPSLTARFIKKKEKANQALETVERLGLLKQSILGRTDILFSSSEILILAKEKP